MDLKEKAKQLPETPGVYIMKDSQEEILYIGKAKSLRNRVGQYFQSANRHAPKILRMIEGIRDFDFIRADTELEALLLECRLIKDLQPMYNSQLKNHKKYCYLFINMSEDFPTLELMAEKGSEETYFGPYTSTGNVERAISVMKDYMKLRQCSNMPRKGTGCLKHQLGFCIAPCTGEISRETYRTLLEQIISFLRGENITILKELENRMYAAAEALDFDKAARYRDDSSALKHLVSKGETLRFAGRNRIIAAIERIDKGRCKLFFIKGNRLLHKEILDCTMDKNDLLQYIVSRLLTYASDLLKEYENHIGKQDIDQTQIVYSYLKNKKECSYKVIPKSWLKEKSTEKLRQELNGLLYML